ncbi:hypothetical protein D9M72_530920 [compost metagenome]
MIDDIVEVLRVLRKAPAFRAHVGVMEAVEGHAEQVEEFEGDVGLQLRRVHGVLEPGALEGLAAEGIAARPDEGVPVGDGKAQVIFHALAENNLVLVVMTEGKRVGAIRAFILDLGDIAEKSCAHGFGSSQG